MRSPISKNTFVILAACSLWVQPSCSDEDAGSGTACGNLLDCCNALSSVLQSQCQATYDQWHDAPGAEKQCQQAMELMGDQCAATSARTTPKTPTTTPPPPRGDSGVSHKKGVAENTDALCSDGIDNDHNGYLDCADFSCSRSTHISVCGSSATAIAENTNALCSDGKDNDRNGFTDCEDWSCTRNRFVTACGEENTNALCSDGKDNDHNGYTDCKDFGCSRNRLVTVCGGDARDPLDRKGCTGAANASGSPLGSAATIEIGKVLADAGGGLKIALQPKSLVDGALIVALYFTPVPGQYSYPPASGRNGCALLRLRNGTWAVVDKSPICEFSFADLQLASRPGVCDGTLTGTYLGTFTGNKTVSGTFHLPTDIAASQVSEPSCRSQDSPCTVNSQCCSQSCAPAWGLCY